MRYRLDLLVLLPLFASRFFESTATMTRQNAEAAHDFRGSLVALARGGPALRAADC